MRATLPKELADETQLHISSCVKQGVNKVQTDNDTLTMPYNTDTDRPFVGGTVIQSLIDRSLVAFDFCGGRRVRHNQCR